MRAHVATLLLSLALTAPLAVTGCASDPSDGLTDAGSQTDAGDAGALADAGSSDAGADAGDAGSTPDAGDAGCTADQLTALEASIAAKLDAAATNPDLSSTPDFTLLLETEDGRTYAHSHGASSATTSYESASTSKWVSAVVILDRVDQGDLSLDTKAHALLPFWTETTVSLRDLLSFTSGFNDEPLCLNSGSFDFGACVENIYSKNSATAPATGTVFHYSSTHLQVAGLMAIQAAGAADWSALFADWKARTGLFPTSIYDLPSATNPRLAGGMHWTAEEYLAFLRALDKGQLLQPATQSALLADQRGTATVEASPAWDKEQEDWSYGLGNWLECPTAKVLGGFDCGAGHRNSSPGAYGAYPFIDFDHHYFGILARQGDRGKGFEGIDVFRAAGPEITRWVDLDCGP
jgi:CubicO group peptidase (beta-lactamase class C family)